MDAMDVRAREIGRNKLTKILTKLLQELVNDPEITAYVSGFKDGVPFNDGPLTVTVTFGKSFRQPA